MLTQIRKKQVALVLAILVFMGSGGWSFSKHICLLPGKSLCHQSVKSPVQTKSCCSKKAVSRVEVETDPCRGCCDSEQADGSSQHLKKPLCCIQATVFFSLPLVRVVGQEKTEQVEPSPSFSTPPVCMSIRHAIPLETGGTFEPPGLAGAPVSRALLNATHTFLI